MFSVFYKGSCTAGKICEKVYDAQEFLMEAGYIRQTQYNEKLSSVRH